MSHNLRLAGPATQHDPDRSQLATPAASQQRSARLLGRVRSHACGDEPANDRAVDYRKQAHRSENPHADQPVAVAAPAPHDQRREDDCKDRPQKHPDEGTEDDAADANGRRYSLGRRRLGLGVHDTFRTESALTRHEYELRGDGETAFGRADDARAFGLAFTVPRAASHGKSRPSGGAQSGQEPAGLRRLT